MPYEVVNPATGTLEASYPDLTDAEVGSVLERTARAYESWRRTAIADRRAALLRVAELYAERTEELAAIITREMGKTTKEAVDEVSYSIDIYRYYADNAEQLLADQPLPSQSGGTAVIRRSP